MFSLNCRGRILSLDHPKIMGVLNLTPDSFSDGGKYQGLHAALKHTENMLEAGADIIDIGGYSSRPFADNISAEEELRRIETITEEILHRFPEAFVSIDTFRSFVAQRMLEKGVHIINDISSGNIDENMLETVSNFQAPYIAMHMQGTPQNMQTNPQYKNVGDEVWDFFVEKIREIRAKGIKDIILDPGFGFGKKLLHNYQLLGSLSRFRSFELPILVGISRKSMLYKLLDTTPHETREAAAALHFQALTYGAAIIRVHEVEGARQVVDLFRYMKSNGII
ncbi:MAG: dihydropteroate synthase [Bacteroidota bacterium]